MATLGPLSFLARRDRSYQSKNCRIGKCFIFQELQKLVKYRGKGALIGRNRRRNGRPPSSAFQTQTGVSFFKVRRDKHKTVALWGLGSLIRSRNDETTGGNTLEP